MVNVRLNEEEMSFIDSLVDQGVHRNRSEALRAAFDDMRADYGGAMTMRTLTNEIKLLKHQYGDLNQRMRRIEATCQ